MDHKRRSKIEVTVFFYTFKFFAHERNAEAKTEAKTEAKRQVGENFIVIEFSYRYDKDNAFSDALCNLLAARFRGEVTFSE